MARTFGTGEVVRDRARRAEPDEGGNQWLMRKVIGEPSEEDCGHPWQSVVISGNQWSSVAIHGHQWSSVPSAAIRRTHPSSTGVSSSTAFTCSI